MKYVLFVLTITCAIAFVTVRANESARDVGLREHAQKRVVAAEQMVKYLEQRELGGEPLTASFVETKSNWDHRLLEAKLAAAKDRDEQTQALHACLDQAKARMRLAESITDGGGTYMKRVAEYDVADAQYRLAELTGQ